MELGELAVARGLLTREQLDTVLQGPPGQFVDMVVAAGWVTRAHMEKLQAELDRRASTGTSPAGAGQAVMLGEYRIIREIGHGGMGVVYEAEHVPLRRRVALKVLPRAITVDAKALSRFHREARLLARLEHPGIVRVFGSGQIAGNHFHVMELIEGRSLATMIGETRIDLKKAVRWAREVADALQFAHQCKIVHRDVKPHNILLSGAGRVVLTDFGLARREGSDTLTQTGTSLGTPYYMPPEQASGRLRSIDARSDVYSLGATLYHLVAGRPPYASVPAELIVSQIVGIPPEAPSRLNPSIDSRLESIILRAMEKDPAARYPSAAAFSQDLESWLSGGVAAAERLSPKERAVRLARRYRLGLIGVVGASLVMVGGGAALVLSLLVRLESSERARRHELAVAEAGLRQREQTNRELVAQIEIERRAAESRANARLGEQATEYQREISRLEAEMHAYRERTAAERLQTDVTRLKTIVREHLSGIESTLHWALDPQVQRRNLAEVIETLQAVLNRLEALKDAVLSDSNPDVILAVSEDPEWKALVDVSEPRTRALNAVVTLKARQAWGRWVADRDYKGVKSELKGLRERLPSAEEPSLLLGLLELRAEQLEAAESLLDSHVARFPADVRARLALAECSILRGRLDEASSRLAAASGLDRRNPEHFYLRGRLALARKEYREALSHFESAPWLSDDNMMAADLAAGRALSLLELSRPAEALVVLGPYSRLLRMPASTWAAIAPWSPGRPWTAYEVFIAHARAALACGERESAAASARQALRRKPGDLDAQDLLRLAGESP